MINSTLPLSQEDRVLNRRRFLQGAALTGLGAFVSGASAHAQTPTPASAPDRGPQIDQELIKRFVIAGHGQMEAVKEMLAAQPSIVNAVWDWGGGDFETALGGASHMGRRDIAQFLLENGARIDLFAAAALNKVEIVKAAVAAFPGIVHVRGPHMIPLIAHAEKAGSMEVAEFLRPLVGSKGE